jgi:CRP-like cAMP-binding protein
MHDSLRFAETLRTPTTHLPIPRPIRLAPAMTALCADAKNASALAPRPCQHCSAQHSCPVTRIDADQVVQLQLKEHRFLAGDVLQAQGSTTTAIRIIKSGVTMMRRESRHGKRQSIGMLGRGTVIGSFGLLGRANPVTHIGILEGRYCELPIAAMRRRGLLEDPVFLGHMSGAMAQAFESHFNWCQLSHCTGVARQLAGALLHLSDLQNSLRVRLPNQTTLAELLGTTRESITRAFARLEKEGDVSRSGRYHCDLDVPRLERTIKAMNPPAQ